MVRIADLYALQEIDTAIDAAEHSLAEARDQLAQDSGLVETRTRLAEVEEEFRLATTDLRSAEADAADGRAKVAEVEAKLYGGTVTSSRELRDLQKEVDALQRQQLTRDEVVLAAMARVDAAKTEQASLDAEVRARESTWQSDQIRLSAESTRFEDDIAALHARRLGAARPVDAVTMALYERLRRMRAGRAVARVQRGACQGCHIMLPTTIFQKARNGMVIVQCSSCERILFVG
ncbi:MAG: zinc ribbon domain-containing protein [Dehalococcoidia bacterium]